MSVAVVDLDRATYVHVIYRDRGRVIHDEVLCRRCLEELAHAGAFDPTFDRHGKQTTLEPWHGEPRCSGCEASAS